MVTPITKFKNYFFENIVSNSVSAYVGNANYIAQNGDKLIVS